MNTGERIRILRENKGWSQVDLAAHLNLSRSSISMYESGERVPSSYVFDQLADVFNVDVDYLVARTDKITVLPERLDYENMIDADLNKLKYQYSCLNGEGRKSLLNYADDLVASRRYIPDKKDIPYTLGGFVRGEREAQKESLREYAKRLGISHTYLNTIETGADPRSGNQVTLSVETMNLLAEFYNIPLMEIMSMAGFDIAYEQSQPEPHGLYSLGSAAAGEGIINHADTTTYRVIQTTKVPKHDFILDVKGDSMWPTLYDGDIVYVQKNFIRKNNHIYVLDIDGETVIKRVQFGYNRITLISDNKTYKDRDVTGYELEVSRIEGEVIGWETPIGKEDS